MSKSNIDKQKFQKFFSKNSSLDPRQEVVCQIESQSQLFTTLLTITRVLLSFYGIKHKILTHMNEKGQKGLICIMNSKERILPGTMVLRKYY